MKIWSSNARRRVLDPESRTISLTPASVNLAVSWPSSSRLEAFTTTGHEFSLANSAIRSRLSSVAAYISGLRSAHTFKPAARTSGLLLIRIMPQSLFCFTLLTTASNILASPELSLTATSSGRRVSPTLSYWSLDLSSLASISDSSMVSVIRMAKPGGFSNLFSWRNITVSPPIFNLLSPTPIVTGIMGGADASSNLAFASSEI
ncbi:hypothetical protein ES703_76363 [subsurface metagenome]